MPTDANPYNLRKAFEGAYWVAFGMQYHTVPLRLASFFADNILALLSNTTPKDF